MNIAQKLIEFLPKIIDKGELFKGISNKGEQDDWCDGYEIALSDIRTALSKVRVDKQELFNRVSNPLIAFAESYSQIDSTNSFAEQKAQSLKWFIVDFLADNLGECLKEGE